jgi:hypothetical protein
MSENWQREPEELGENLPSYHLILHVPQMLTGIDPGPEGLEAGEQFSHNTCLIRQRGYSVYENHSMP